MAHARQQLREAVASLVTGLTTTGARVHQSRVFPFQDSDLPALNITTPAEEVIEVYTRTKSVRELTVTVEAFAKAGADVDDTLDTIAAEVEAALYSAPSIGGSAKFAGIATTENTIEAGGDLLVGKATLTVRVVYAVDGSLPTVIL